MLPSLFVAPVQEMRCSITEISKPAQWPATGKKMCMRVAREVPISFCEVCMIYPAPQIVAQSDLVCSFTGFCFPRCGDKR